jgi:hypothetical protein
MRAIERRLIGLALPPVAFCALDMSLTLWGQSAEYWAGNYSHVNEVSPTLNSLLQISPVAFIVGCVSIALLGVTTILLLPEGLALITSIAGVLGGTYGASTWLLFRFHCGYPWINLLLLSAAVVLGVAIRFGWQARPEPGYYLPLRPLWRWTLAVMFVAILIWIILV